jgi:hypothetical protein
MAASTTRTADGDTKFFSALENGHPVRAACAMAGYARSCVYDWRKQDPAFAERWKHALDIAGDLLEEEADRRGRDGYDEPVYYQGEERGQKRKYSDMLLLARLKAIRPEQYREKITMPSMSQQNVTVVLRDFALEALVQKAVRGERIDPTEVPQRLRTLIEKT